MNEVQKPVSAIRSQILQNPDMILGDRELMSALLEADGGYSEGRNIVDLRAKLVERLEERLNRLEATNRTVIAAAYENLAGTNQIHRAVLALLEPNSFRGFLAALGEEVAHILSIDAIRLGLESGSAIPGAHLGPKGPLSGLVIALPRGGVEEYLSDGDGRPARRVTLRRATAQADDLYGQNEALVQSEALLKLDLGQGKGAALLALGAEDPQRFTPDQGTDLLSFFAGAFERVLRRWLA
ncbi:DUF484 family protein [Halovulum dunhuangense]|uniref:DUF484 family protein n=1 Tax=Halovulum dunhuangense TaxID=1505036 RepID=A0A849KVV9_9RHOB|nr:DUF484 family protein [Halovulum dunhuangense]NNU79588.1 DUF484 family protein [Halovulum dunhuangense]